MPGQDGNASSVWATVRGRGVCVAITDDGLEISHPDLADNVAPGLSWDYTDFDTDPVGGEHGTAVAGLAAARGFNDVGVRGVAPEASLAGYNLLASFSDVNQADAMMRNCKNIHVNNNSWGPSDDGSYADPPHVWKEAVAACLASGNGGKGTVYVWAGGNGRSSGDNSNYDGYANEYGVIPVCAVDHAGTVAPYSEPGANLLLCAPSSNAAAGLTTTDRTGDAGYNPPGLSDTDYSGEFGGTSAAAPQVAGVVALLFEANPALTYRDVALILARSARKNDPLSPGWSSVSVVDDGAGGAMNSYSIHHDYGFGVVDAASAVALASGWTSVGGFGTLKSEEYVSSPGQTIPDGTGWVSDVIVVSSSSVRDIEFVEIEIVVEHSKRGHLKVLLDGAGGIQSELAAARACCEGSGEWSWSYGARRYLDQAGDGNWRLTVSDTISGESGVWKGWKLRIFGR